MADDRDDFDGIDISGPWGGVRIGSGMRSNWDALDSDGDAEYRRIRRKVRRRLNFFRNTALFVFIVGGLALLDGITGGGWWVQWVAIIWGAFIGLEFFTTFIGPSFWGKEAEERMVRREMERRRGRASVVPDRDDTPPQA